MSDETLECLIRRAFAYADGQVSFAFQGGEPTLAGLPFFQRLIALQAKYNTRSLTVHNAIQTNGFAIDEEWASFLSKHRFLVGVSLDGTQALHDRNRVDQSGKETYAHVMNNLGILHKHKVDFNILCVVTNDAAMSTKEIFEQLKGFGYLQFIPCIDAFENEGAQMLSAQAYGEFLMTCFDLYEQALYQGKYVSVRNFDNYISRLLGYTPEMCGMNGTCSRNYLVEADGSVYPCDFYVLDQWSMGNVNTDNFLRLSKSLIGKQFVEESKHMHKSCFQCQWFFLCRGGCKRDCEIAGGNGRGLNRFCEGFQTFFEHKADRMLKLAKMFANDQMHPKVEQK